MVAGGGGCSFVLQKLTIMKSLSAIQKINLIIAALFCIIAPGMGYLKIGLPPIIIIGGSALVGFTFWYFTYLRNPADPKIILPIFVLTVACLQIHIVEEYLTGFGPAMSRLFNISWTEKSFIIVFALIGPTLYTLTTLGLYYRIPIAGFIAWFIFIGPGVAEFTHFIFPLMEPDIAPTDVNHITQFINGTEVANMPNYYIKETGHYYFSGMYTAILPMIPGIYAIYRLTKEHRKQARLIK
jgi:hypothetical protein